MVIHGDYHTHTTYSRKNHAKGSILENAFVAKEKGLKQIAITDHGFNQIIFGVKRKHIEQIKQEISVAKDITGVDILLGVEANLISMDGDIDINEDDLAHFDIISMGHHKVVKYSSFADFRKIGVANLLADVFKPSKELISRNTTAFLKAIDKNNINILTHLNYGCKIDTLAVAKMAKEKGVLIEISGKKKHFSDSELIEMANEGVKFVINSDAHSPENVGEVNRAINKVIQLDIPTNLIVNLDKLPNFRKGN